MTPTEADIAKARELLPCNCGYEIPDEYGHGFTHAQDCPATRRPSLATALSQARAEGREEAAKVADKLHKKYMAESGALPFTESTKPALLKLAGQIKASELIAVLIRAPAGA